MALILIWIVVVDILQFLSITILIHHLLIDMKCPTLSKIKHNLARKNSITARKQERILSRQEKKTPHFAHELEKLKKE